MTSAVLVVEDDDLLRDYLVEGLRQNGYAAIGVGDGQGALAHAVVRAFDLVILDRNLPGMDGIAVLQALRHAGWRMPVLILTTIAAIDERVRGLDAGADDYMAKPFSITELLARVRALVRRPHVLAAETLSAGDLRLETREQRAYWRDRALDLTAQDLALLGVFLRAPRQVFTRDALLDVMLSGGDISPAAVEHAVSRLRRKLDTAGASGAIDTVRGVGYRLAAALTGA